MHLVSALAFSTAFLQVQGHMLLHRPTRFPGTGDNSPLSGPMAGGPNNYPCKTMGDYSFDFDRTQIPAGSSYTVSFEGQSVHGGGSCQFALSRDLEPTAQSEFKVVHSIEGGCPARNTPGNLGDDTSATAIDPFTYNFTMPTDIAPGQYTFAWTWLNKVGNREFYMNCAPIEVTGGSSQKREVVPRASSSALDSLPDLFLANIDDVECTTSDWPGDMSYPNPGNSVEQNVPANERSAPIGDVSKCHAPVGAQSTSGSGTPSSGSGGDNNYNSPDGSYSTNPSYNSGSSDSPSYYSPPAPAPAPSAPAPSSPAPSVPATAPYPITNSTPPSSGSCASGQVSCTTSGAVVCIGSNQFGICNWGCAVPQDLAAGTSCTNGVIGKRGLRIPPQVRPNRIYNEGRRLLGLL